MSYIVYLTHFLSYKLLFLYLLSTIKRMCPSFGHGMLTQTRAFTHIPHLACHIIMHELKKHRKNKKRQIDLPILRLYGNISTLRAYWNSKSKTFNGIWSRYLRKEVFFWNSRQLRILYDAAYYILGIRHYSSKKRWLIVCGLLSFVSRNHKSRVYEIEMHDICFCNGFAWEWYGIFTHYQALKNIDEWPFPDGPLAPLVFTRFHF